MIISDHKLTKSQNSHRRRNTFFYRYLTESLIKSEKGNVLVLAKCSASAKSAPKRYLEIAFANSYSRSQIIFVFCSNKIKKSAICLLDCL